MHGPSQQTPLSLFRTDSKPLWNLRNLFLDQTSNLGRFWARCLFGFRGSYNPSGNGELAGRNETKALSLNPKPISIKGAAVRYGMAWFCPNFRPSAMHSTGRG